VVVVNVWICGWEEGCSRRDSPRRNFASKSMIVNYDRPRVKSNKHKINVNGTAKFKNDCRTSYIHQASNNQNQKTLTMHS
jgi:hypothetical protein